MDEHATSISSLANSTVLAAIIIAIPLGIAVFFGVQKADYALRQFDFFIRSAAIDGCYQVASKSSTSAQGDTDGAQNESTSSVWPDEEWYNKCMKQKGY
jgi:hypothetical protein